MPHRYIHHYPEIEEILDKKQYVIPRRPAHYPTILFDIIIDDRIIADPSPAGPVCGNLGGTGVRQWLPEHWRVPPRCELILCCALRWQEGSLNSAVPVGCTCTKNSTRVYTGQALYSALLNMLEMPQMVYFQTQYIS